MFGIAWLTPLIAKLIGGAIALVALGFLLHGYNEGLRKEGDKRTEDKMRPQITAAEQARDKALAANDTLKGDLAILESQRKACSDAVERIRKASQRTTVIIEQRRPSDEQRLAEIAPEKAALMEALGLATPKRECKDELAARDAMWRGIAKQRARDYPPTTPAAKGALSIEAPK